MKYTMTVKRESVSYHEIIVEADTVEDAEALGKLVVSTGTTYHAVTVKSLEFDATDAAVIGSIECEDGTLYV